ncbi:MAG: arsinothricin resistance N-acetyltransferase ArsN1 [Firmicutes bacterium]|jgi:phosphinothricin acetyltransferase|uniref:GNAT family N-acetyltransferase n=1 Tax=Sulfobacillus benefaciens TaxID=453960 RepID=A0A2T2X4M0_9FIRM|nr:arsinothricin resistance N-acetyltransferase ArsN1 [Bacillota bacterium]MCL5013711.1 arsinothricin resistance N-acetyltransferase ArsN1 [Bacillota bacterium]PSR29388.1 MAG: GNAT family N-acetyltransferase [Sulfobacillus benefaciens]
MIARRATVTDARRIAEIYNQGIEEGTATFETEPRTVQDRREWLQTHEGYPAVVVEEDGYVVGFATAGEYRPRRCYQGIGEFSVYIDRDFRGRGLGKMLLNALIADARRLGYWKLLSRVFDFNIASRRLCRACGFREVGVYERHGKLGERWVDCIIVEKLIPENLR